MKGSDTLLELNFQITHQHINRVDTEKPVADSKNYLYAHFDFLTEEWENKVVTAIFTKGDDSYYMLIDIDGDCLVPWEVISEGNVYVSCFTGELITVNKSRVYIRKSGYVEDANNSQEPTPNIYEQLTSQFGQLANQFEKLKDDINYAVENIDGGLFTDWEEGSD